MDTKNSVKNDNKVVLTNLFYKKKLCTINKICNGNELMKLLIICALHHQLTIAKENSQPKMMIVTKYADLREKNPLSLR